MSFLTKKIRLTIFLTKRLPRSGLSRWLRGMRERKVGYLAMELADVLPPDLSTIIDVGAHDGLTADALEMLYRPRCLWVVEPNPAHGSHLEERFRNRPQVKVVRSCLGEAVGEVDFNVYDFDAASSLFSLQPGHLASLGIGEGGTSLKVPMTTLRELIPADLVTLDLIKLDCQGAELAVLKGAGERIHSVRWIYCEISIDPIYKGAPLFGEVHAFLRGAGFELRKLSGFSGAGVSIQWADALYANREMAAK